MNGAKYCHKVSLIKTVPFMRFTSNCGEAVLPTEEMNLFSIFFSFLEKNFIIGARKIIRVFSERVLQ